MIRRQWGMANSRVNRIQYRIRRGTKMAKAQRVAVFVQRNRLHINPRQHYVDTPRVTGAVTAGIAEVVVDDTMRCDLSAVSSVTFPAGTSIRQKPLDFSGVSVYLCHSFRVLQCLVWNFTLKSR
jgi:hypothetical protein